MNSLWGIEWHSRNRLGGETTHLMYSGLPLIFKTRKQAREYIRKNWGYILCRQDLKSEPHGWRLPRPVRVKIVKEEGVVK